MNICEIACLECKKIEKKQKKISALPSASTRQSWAFFPAEPSFAECWRGTRQSDQTYAECQHSAKNFSKKNAECLTRHHSAKNLKKKFLCRVPDTSALGKGCRQVDGARYLCRVLVWHSAKIPLPTTSLPNGLCREPHSAKPLPTAKAADPVVWALWLLVAATVLCSCYYSVASVPPAMEG